MRSIASASVLVFLFLSLRLFIAERQTLWMDDFLSIACATGHSVFSFGNEVLKPGDFYSPSQPVDAAFYREYLAFDPWCKMPESIARACLRADGNAPVYYFFLYLWFQVFGISDLSARLPSILFSLVALPFLWLTGKSLSGKPAAFISCLLFTFAPASLFYSTEVRNYSLTVCASIVLVWLTLRLGSDQQGKRAPLLILWAIVGGLGLLNSVLFLGTWVPCVLWLLWHRQGMSLRLLLLTFMAAAAIAASWYITVALISVQHITPPFLNAPIPWLLALTRPSGHLLAFFSSCALSASGTESVLGVIGATFLLPLVLVILPGTKNQFKNRLIAIVSLIAFWCAGVVALIVCANDYAWQHRTLVFAIAGGAMLTLLVPVLIFMRKKHYAIIENFDQRVNLLYLNVAASIVLPTICDLIKSTRTAIHSRYALECLGPAFILAAIALSKCRKRTQVCIGLLAICAWIPAYWTFVATEGPMGENYKAIARLLARAKENEVIIATGHYCSSLLAVAYYLPTNNTIIGQFNSIFGGPPPDNSQQVLQSIKGKSGVYFVDLSFNEGHYPLEDSLQQHAKLEKQYIFYSVPAKLIFPCKYRVLHFVPKEGDIF